MLQARRYSRSYPGQQDEQDEEGGLERERLPDTLPRRETRVEIEEPGGTLLLEPEQEQQEQQKTPVVEPEAEPLPQLSGPARQKIVVLGASGRIGRMVIRKLMEMPRLEATVVAHVRDTSKASWALFCDAVVLPMLEQDDRRGAQLEIVVGNLVTPQDLPGYTPARLNTTATLDKSNEKDRNITDKYYGRRVSFVPQQDNTTDDALLQEAIQDSTAVISCVGAVRKSNLWTDYLAVPLWRLLRHDVSGWCRDDTHPYYVHYLTTRKALELAEEEQKKREAALEAMDEEDRPKDNIPQRIRFVRVSDLCLSKQPWDLIPLVTNAVQSVVFRYQDMAERLLEESSLVDTVVLRPGDLTDEERVRAIRAVGQSSLLLVLLLPLWLPFPILFYLFFSL